MDDEILEDTSEEISEEISEEEISGEAADEGGAAEDEPSIPEEEISLDKEERIGAVEAMLFCTGASLEISRIAQCASISEDEAWEAVAALENRYRNKRSGLEIVRLERSVQLCSKKSCYNVLRRLVGTPKKATLTETMLETLSIVAYKQPVTRIEIENIRGVSCGHQINKLLEYDLIKELGRLDAPGKPLLFGTTEQFLKSFAVSSIDELPQASPDTIAEFRAEAEKEIDEVKV